MLRAYKTILALAVLLAATVCVTNVAQAMTTNVYFIQELVTGYGNNEVQAKANAYQAMADEIAAIQSNLPPNHFIVAETILDEGYILPTVYEIRFELMIYVESGGGGGPGID